MAFKSYYGYKTDQEKTGDNSCIYLYKSIKKYMESFNRTFKLFRQKNWPVAVRR